MQGEVISGEHKVVPGIRSDLAVIPQISDQIIFAFTRRLVIDEKAFTSWFQRLSADEGGGDGGGRIKWAKGVQRCTLSAPSHNCDVAYGNAGLLMNIHRNIIINGNPPPIPPHRVRTIRQRPQTIEAQLKFRREVRPSKVQRGELSTCKLGGANKLIIKIAERKPSWSSEWIWTSFPVFCVCFFYCNQIQEIHGGCNCWQMQLSIRGEVPP